ncbi:MAG: nucleotidyl transferase AbiEii/AbiGii toxin family protein [Candidatus Omnitrophica bacterium]|nr:nucleotidyl transferase AbiEii/AbiGii toxin family protein [Candidatus Omnitrophota bacterium]
MEEIFFEVLTNEQQEILPNFVFLREYNFYLAGGTALALQIKHRTSIDFDFYTNKNFYPLSIYEKLQKCNSKKFLLSTIRDDDTLIVEINNIIVSFFYYPYKIIGNILKSQYLDLASIEDIAAMKVIAIIQRGAKRDFIDMYFLIKKLGLENIFKIAKEKYPGFNEYLALQSLTYFEDAEAESDLRDIKLLKSFDWIEVKKYFLQESERILENWRQNK